MLAKPHGGSLVNCFVAREEAADFERQVEGSPSIVLDAVALADFGMLAAGAYSPLSGFMSSRACMRVSEDMRLEDGTLWPIPIALPVPADEKSKLRTGEFVRLVGMDGVCRGVLQPEEVFDKDLKREAQLVYGTSDPLHPGVANLLSRSSMHVAGPIRAFSAAEVGARHLTPQASREVFQKKNWQKVVGFQTRNPVHRAHEYILKCALEICDGLFLHPLIGFTKDDDVPADVRMRCYDALLGNVLPQERVVLSPLPAAMRYAGPREAILHALIRKNFGCSHFIVGRDHAGVGNYYDSYAAQKIFDGRERDVEIEILRFEHTFYCRACGQMGSAKTCPHHGEEHVLLSGTKVRELLRSGVRPPEEITRPQVADILIEWSTQ